MDYIDERNPEMLCIDELLCTMPPGHVVTLERDGDRYLARWYDCEEEKDIVLLPRINLFYAINAFRELSSRARRKAKNEERISRIDINGLKRELTELLSKYDIAIGFTCDDGSDTYGITGDAIEICDRETGRSLFRVNGWGLSAHDLKD